MKTAPLLHDAMKAILLCCTKLEFIDSSGIGSLILLMNTSRNLNIDLIVYDMQDAITKVFKTAFLDKFFRMLTLEDVRKTYPGPRALTGGAAPPPPLHEPPFSELCHQAPAIRHRRRVHADRSIRSTYLARISVSMFTRSPVFHSDMMVPLIVSGYDVEGEAGAE